MPKVSVNGCLYNYEERGAVEREVRGEAENAGTQFPQAPAAEGAGAQTIFFGHGLLYAWQSFEHQIAHFAQKGYRVIAVDWRGQGETEGAGEPDAYSLYRLGDDAYALLQQLGVQRCHWVGLSMGGMVAMRLYPRHPELFQSLALIDTSAADDQEHLPMYRQMAETYLAYGAVPPIIQGLDATFYTSEFPQKNPAEVERWHQYWQNMPDRQAEYNAVIPVIDRDDVSELVNQISVPTLILCGEQDVSTQPQHSEDLHRRIKGSKYSTIPNCGHMSSIEQAEAVTQALDDFLSSLG